MNKTFCYIYLGIVTRRADMTHSLEKFTVTKQKLLIDMSQMLPFLFSLINTNEINC